MDGRAARVVLGLLLAVAILTLTVLESPTASLRILWRFAVLSYDHPATQLLDEIASDSSTASGVGTQAQQITRLVPTGRFVLTSEPGHAGAPVLCSGITRAPPAA